MEWLTDALQFWDFHTGNPEGIHQLMHLFSDRGIPASLRQMNAYSGHTYQFTKEDGSVKYIKIHLRTRQGIGNFTREEATKMAGENPDYLLQDMFDAIEGGRDAEHEKWVSEVCAFTSTMSDLDFEQATGLWTVLGRDPGHQARFVENVAVTVQTSRQSGSPRPVYALPWKTS
ncbi:heme-dependent catalase [Aspergillus ellipticus CBS 707.79]|uniref:Heme-dependent catalase n=1 Tax=Aspergillus ellipticus CBS 707.79 TaxID=1448320 RepID=A0A319CTW0_9EURO|nr:heme-dependent catalase [Aspergillus ellipticus CBS 707.79]